MSVLDDDLADEQVVPQQEDVVLPFGFCADTEAASGAEASNAAGDLTAR